MPFEKKNLKHAKLIIEIRHYPILDWSDAIKSFAKAGLSDYSKWQEQDTAHRFLDDKNSTFLNLQPRRFGLDFEAKRDATFVRNRVKSVSDVLHKYHTSESFVRVGIRTQSYYTIDYKFEELVELASQRFLNTDKSLTNILSASPSDLLYLVEYEEKETKYRCQAGPSTKTQLANQAPMTFNKERRITELPDVCFFMDIDCYKEEFQSKDLLTFIESQVEYTSKKTEELSRYLIEK